jgi:hypothetical protein
MIDPNLMRPWVLRIAAMCALAVPAAGGAMAAPASPAPLEFGVDRSNMGTQWTLA